MIELKLGAEVVVNKVPKLFDQNFQKTNTKFARTGTWNISDDLILTINNQSRVELNDFQVVILDCPYKVANLLLGEHKTKAGDLFQKIETPHNLTYVVVIIACTVLLQLKFVMNMQQMTRVLRATKRSDCADNSFLWLYCDFDIQVCIWVDTGQIIEVGSFCFD